MIWCVRTSFLDNTPLIIMSVKGRIANFYHNKSQVANSLWILAQVRLKRERYL